MLSFSCSGDLKLKHQPCKCCYSIIKKILYKGSTIPEKDFYEELLVHSRTIFFHLRYGKKSVGVHNSSACNPMLSKYYGRSASHYSIRQRYKDICFVFVSVWRELQMQDQQEQELYLNFSYYSIFRKNSTHKWETYAKLQFLTRFWNSCIEMFNTQYFVGCIQHMTFSVCLLNSVYAETMLFS